MANYRYFIDLPNGETVRVEKVQLDRTNTFVGFLDGSWQPVTRKVIMKQFPIRHECDARCTNATGRVMKCECSCGGKNHGKGSISFVCEAA